MAHPSRAFGLIASFPNLKNGEFETTERIKLAAEMLDAACVVYDPFGQVLSNPHNVPDAAVQFVISLHFRTPKCFDTFTYIALWNPLQFYFDWGYETYSQHLLSYDDVLSCSSPVADDHVRRLLARQGDRPWPPSTLYHSLAGPILPPNPSPGRLFYCGINWERLTRAHGRFHDLFVQLDRDDIVSFYGPQEFLGAHPWEGFSNFRGEIPFDGHSVVERINECGISLVFSSDAHKESALMSSRLFESCAAGAVIVCDENPFARRFFGDTLLYVDTNQPLEEVYRDVRRHYDWVRSHRAEAATLAAGAQAVFKERFELRGSLLQLLDGHAEHAARLASRWMPRADAGRVLVVRVLQHATEAALSRLERSIRAQRYANLEWAVLVDSALQQQVDERLSRSCPGSVVRVVGVPDLEAFRPGTDKVPPKRAFVGIGQATATLVAATTADFFCLSSEDEECFSDHLASLVRALGDAPLAMAAVADSLHESRLPSGLEVSLSSSRAAKPLGAASPMQWSPGRFLFRRSLLDETLLLFLKSLDYAGAQLLLYEACRRGPLVPTGRASLRSAGSGWRRLEPRRAQYERELVRDYIGNYRGPGAAEAEPGPTHALSRAVESSYVALFENRIDGDVRAQLRTPLPAAKPWSGLRQRTLRTLAWPFARNKRRTAIFGCGRAGLQAFRTRPFGDAVVFFSDNDPAKHGKQICGRPIKPPAALLDENLDAIVIASMHYREIYDQLVDLGIPPAKLQVDGLFRK